MSCSAYFEILTSAGFPWKLKNLILMVSIEMVPLYKPFGFQPLPLCGCCYYNSEMMGAEWDISNFCSKLETVQSLPLPRGVSIKPYFMIPCPAS